MNVRLMVSPAQLRQKLNEAMTQGSNLLATDARDDLTVLSAGYQTWDKRNQLILEGSFETKSFFQAGPKADYLDFRGLSYGFGLDHVEGVSTEGLRSDIEKKIQRLAVIRENLDFYRYESQRNDDRGLAQESPSIFLIHGRAEAPRLQVQNLLLRATAHEAVVLMEKTNQGATIIEKLEEQLGQRAGFAVVIITGDDHGGLAGSPEMQPRARQNVILELGYAMGRVGRRNVTILYEEGVELPSDIAGVAYYPLDSHGGWQRHLLGDLKAAGFQVSSEALLS
ncbi:nucleotide-binding protein [Pseudarthrobacter oxydans]|uniref:TIR domain-containing protein n=1 Tax=Pseudarthrobacter oxydans TaxID=1671 RepID=UPI0015731EFA|nr:nucleotide-binding protein [Pseudarthrobacter oxydans]NSX36521.1 nucleotide-binding protein [Pseudarthrobacter oxydans]